MSRLFALLALIVCFPLLADQIVPVDHCVGFCPYSVCSAGEEGAQYPIVIRKTAADGSIVLVNRPVTVCRNENDGEIRPVSGGCSWKKGTTIPGAITHVWYPDGSCGQFDLAPSKTGVIVITKNSEDPTIKVISQPKFPFTTPVEEQPCYEGCHETPGDEVEPGGLPKSCDDTPNGSEEICVVANPKPYSELNESDPSVTKTK